MDTAVLYENLHRMIHATVYEFLRKYGGDRDDLLSQAHLSFMLACQTYDPNKLTKIGTWVRSKIWWDLLELKRQNIKQAKHQVELRHYMPEVRKFSLHRLFTKDLSPDGRKAVRTALRTQRSKRRTKSIALSLLDSGWSGQRVLNTFQEIREAIS